MNLLRALFSISAFTFLSRLLGLARDFVIARLFGAGIATDAFIVAFRFPNLFRRLFAEGAFSQAFVPILAEYKSQKTEEQTQQLISRVSTLLMLIVVFVSVLGIIASPWIIRLTAPGFYEQADKFQLTVTMTRITFPYLIFISLVALSSAILNTWGKYNIPAFTPVLLNVAFIIGGLFLSPYIHPPILVLAWAVLLGGILQLALQFYPLMRLNLFPRFRLVLKDEGVRRIAKLMIPAMLGVSVAQISLLINTSFASFLPNGSVSWLYYADRLMEFPVGLLGVALSTILLPNLSKLHSTGNKQEFSETLNWGLKLTVLLVLPATLGLSLLATPLISTLFMYGAFKPEDMLQTQAAIFAYSLGIPGLVSIKILAPALYSRQNIRTPVKFAIMSLILTQVMNLIFIGTLHHVALALSISIAALFNASMLLHYLRKQRIFIANKDWPTFIAKLIVALIPMSLFLFACSGDKLHWIAINSWHRLLHLVLLILGSIIIYLFALYWQGLRLHHFYKRTPSNN